MKPCIVSILVNREADTAIQFLAPSPQSRLVAQFVRPLVLIIVLKGNGWQPSVGQARWIESSAFALTYRFVICNSGQADKQWIFREVGWWLAMHGGCQMGPTHIYVIPRGCAITRDRLVVILVSTDLFSHAYAYTDHPCHLGVLTVRTQHARSLTHPSAYLLTRPASRPSSQGYNNCPFIRQTPLTLALTVPSAQVGLTD